MTLARFAVTDAEYDAIEHDLGQLVHFAGWRMLNGNHRNNHTDDEVDLAQEGRLSLVIAACMFKRQCWIEACFEALDEHYSGEDLEALKVRWIERKRGNRKPELRFDTDCEDRLAALVRHHVPRNERPDMNAPLRLNTKFRTYAKSVLWNTFKGVGRKITREKPIRVGMVTLDAVYVAGQVIV